MAMDQAAQMEHYKKLANVLLDAGVTDKVKFESLQSISDSLEVSSCPCVSIASPDL